MPSRGIRSSLICLLSSLAFTFAHAQSAQQIDQALQTLPAADRPVIQQLGDLNQLPVGQWRYHAGNLAHGEDPTLDDSSWPIAKPHSQFPVETVWFRQWIQVPKTLHGYDLTGTRIWFQFDAFQHGPMPQIIFFDGRRVALGDDLAPVVLFDKAQPGQKILVAVKLLATVGTKTFAGVKMRIDFAPNRPNPNDLHDEFLTAAFLVPSLSHHVSADEHTLDQSISQIDMQALANGNQAAFDASLRKAQSTLEALRPMMQQFTFHLTGNSHMDAAWLWPWTEAVDFVHRTFSTALQLMNEYPGYTYTQSATAYYAWMANKYPDIDQQIAQRIKDGRWEVVGGMWVEPDLNMPDGESTARSILIGKRWFKQHYGVDVTVGWNPDSFGYDWQLPQIYKRSGIDFFVTQKMSWNDTNQLPLKLFWWEAPDGSKVLTYFPHDYANTNLDPVRLAADFQKAREYSPGLTSMMDLYGVGDHGGGPTRAMLDQGDHWMQPGKVTPHYEYGTSISYFDQVEKQLDPNSPVWDYRTIARGYHPPPTPPAGEVAIPTWDDELYLEYHRGVYTTQAKQKSNMRKSSVWALDAEKYASLAWLDGSSYPDAELTRDWEKVTFNQFHDLAAGSGIGVIYKDAQKDYNVVRWSTNQIDQTALKTVAEHIDTAGSGVPVVVFNPLGWSRNGIFQLDVQMPSPVKTVSVIDPHGHVVPSEVMHNDASTGVVHLLIDAQNVPSMGYEVLHVVPGHRTFPSDLQAHGTTLENSALRVVIDPHTGCITSLYDKRSHFETLAPNSCGNELQAFVDKPKNYDAWNIDPGTLDKPPTKLTMTDSVQLVEDTPLRAVVRITRHWDKSKFVQDVILYAGSDQAVVSNDIDWHETHILLKAAFALSATSPFATYEIPYGTIQRPTTRNNSFEDAKFEVPALRWADLGNAQHGFSLINESKYGYDSVGNLLRLSLLRSPVWPDPNADRGHQHFLYALYPHAGSWKQALTVRHGYNFNYPLQAWQTDAHAGSLPSEHSFVAVSPTNVVLTAMKKAEDNNALIFHLYEWAGKSGNISIHVPPGATAASQVNLMEQPAGGSLPLHDNTVTVPVKPYEIVAVRVDYPHQDTN